MKESASRNCAAKFSFLLHKTNVMSKNFFASSLAKNNILDAVFNSRYNNSIYNISSMSISNALGASNFDEMLGFIDDELGLFGVFVVECKPATKKFKRYARRMNRKYIVIKD